MASAWDSTTVTWKLDGETVVMMKDDAVVAEKPEEKAATVAEVMAELDALKEVAMSAPEMATIEHTKEVVAKVAEDDLLAKIDKLTSPPEAPKPGENYKAYLTRTKETEDRAMAAFAEYGREDEIPDIEERDLYKEAAKHAEDEVEGRLDLLAVLKEMKLTRTGAASVGYGKGWMAELENVNPDGQSKEKLQELEYLTNCLLDSLNGEGEADWLKAVELTNKVYKERPVLKVPGGINGKGHAQLPKNSLKSLEGYAKGAGTTKAVKGGSPSKVSTKASKLKAAKKAQVKLASTEGFTTYGHKIMDCTWAEAHYSKMPKGTENNPYMMQPYHPSVFAPGTKGGKGLCAHDNKAAEWMVKGETRWWSLCLHHAQKWTGWDYRVGDDGSIIGSEG